MTYEMWVIVIAGLLALPAAGGAASTTSMDWSEMGRAVHRKDVAIELFDGVRVEGNVLAVNPDNLSVKVRKTSDSAIHPEGQALIPRASISVVEVRGHRTRWQMIGSAIGAAAGIPLCVFFAAYANNEGGEAGGFCTAAIAGAAGLGYLAGSIGHGSRRIQLR